MSKIKNSLINFEREEENVDLLDEQYHYKTYLKELEYDSKRIYQNKSHGENHERLWNGSFDH